MEIRRLGEVCLDDPKSGREGCLGKGGGGVAEPSSGFLSPLTRSDQSPDDDRKIFRTEVRFFCRSVRPGVCCSADSTDGCGLEPGSKGDLTGKVGEVGDEDMKLSRRPDGLDGTLPLIDMVRKKSLKPAKPVFWPR
jgi:hypothetical protein